MAKLASPPQFEQLFARVERRQRLVKWLRWIVPIVGCVFFLALTVPVLVERLLPTAQFEGVRLDQDKLIVDGPRATGVLSDGGTYEMTAKSASTKIVNQDKIDLVDMKALLHFIDGEQIVGTSATGTFSLKRNILTLDSQIDVKSSQNDQGEIGTGMADLNAQTFNGYGGVAFDFANGSTLRAQNMFYDDVGKYWKFERASLTIPPKQEQANDDEN